MNFKILAVCALSGGLASAAAQALQSPEEVSVLPSSVLPLEYDVDLDLAPLDRLPASCFIDGKAKVAALAPVSHGERQRWTLRTGEAPSVTLASDRAFKLGDAGEVVLPAKLTVNDGRFTTHNIQLKSGADAARLARFRSAMVTFDEKSNGLLTGALELTAFRGCATEPCKVPVVLCSAELPFVARARGTNFLASK